MGFLLKWGQSYPGDIQPGTVQEAMLKFFAFLNSPFVVSRPQRPDRAARREVLRQGLVEDEPLVHFITLRQPVTDRERQDKDGHVVQWKHRWWVRGHFRAQWLPSQQGHRLTWIAPYVKGPEGAEFTQPVYAVVR